VRVNPRAGPLFISPSGAGDTTEIMAPRELVPIIAFLVATLLGGCFAEAPMSEANTIAATDDGACQAIEEPDGTECPAICNGGCVENECQIVCDDANPCSATELACPPDFACDVDCAGTNVCEASVFTCPNDYACSLSCEGESACATAQLECGFSECAIECGADETACAGTIVRCSGAACLAECASDVAPTLDGCDGACSCTEC